jgi:DNA mismatch repair protein MutS2
MPEIPDLLHAAPTLRIDRERTKLALMLAFAGGNSGGLFSEALDNAALAPSSWRSEEFAGALFLQRLVSQCFRVKIAGHEPVLNTRHLLRLVSQPPLDFASVEFRRNILAEVLARPSLRPALERLYSDLCQLRALLENGAAQRIWDANRRRLDILRVFKTIIDNQAESFALATSGLERLSKFGARFRACEAYQALSDLLASDTRSATVSLRLAVGADGNINAFEILSVAEATSNPFVHSVARRWLAKLELFVRGYRFSDSEVLARLIDAVASGLEDELVMLVQLLGDLEFYLGALGFRDQAQAAGLAVCLPSFTPAGAARVLVGLFNPLLLTSGAMPIACDIVTNRLSSTVLVTGPNSGGKTRLLQSLGITQLFAQSGLFVPARAAELALASGLVASLIEEVRADQTEGRLGMELMRIRVLFERLEPGALVLLDELCSGTNPSEGEQVFELVVTMLNQLQPQAFITTHFLAFASRLQAARSIPNLDFLQVELTPQLSPTYQFAPGVARTSLAAHTAERLGVTGEQLANLIERNLRKQRLGSQPV